jgi:hypothetical protein
MPVAWQRQAMPGLEYATNANGYLFITDYYNYRVIGSGPNGYRCIVGCSGVNGLLSDQLSNPSSLSFDSHGNLFVADTANGRIQKFLLETNLCGKCLSCVSIKFLSKIL